MKKPPPDYRPYPTTEPRPTADEVIDAACELFEVEREKVGTRKNPVCGLRDTTGRTTPVVIARAAICVVLRNACQMSYPEVAAAIGLRSHCTLADRKSYVKTLMVTPIGIIIHDELMSRVIRKVRERKYEGGKA